MMVLDKSAAEKIAKKLGAKTETGRKAHDYALVFHNGRLVAKFGIRRGSNKNAGHGHIPADLHLSPHNCRKLAECTFSAAEWLGVMAERGLLG